MTAAFRPRLGDRAALRWLLVAGWVAVIFAFSAQPGTDSSQLSHGAVAVIERVLGGLLGGIDPAAVHYAVRKLAHVLEYLVLGALVAWAWRAWPHPRSRPPSSTAGPLARAIRAPSLPALAVTVALAAADEFHQLFVPGRGAAVTDVLIDSIGAALGITLVALLARRARRSGNTA